MSKLIKSGDEARKALAALGVGVVDVMVHGELIPFLGHFNEMKFVEEFAHDAGIARSRLAEIVDELDLFKLVVPRADNGFHDLDEHAAGIKTESRLRAVEHFAVQSSQSGQAIFSGTGIVQTAQQVDDSLSHAIFMGRCKIENAVRMKAGLENFMLKIGRRSVVNDIIDHFQEFTILSVEIEHFSHGGHLRKGRNAERYAQILSNCYI